ncbi:MAG: glycine cleavage system aminomethyltransferase GcvT [Deltaproteobacteria bacterium]|nr:glycine cleavage system aminomethyltransferase GcvT [Deltaproteobacteria bacterium]
MKQTPLFHEHTEHDARIVEFAHWAMPVQYPTGTLVEHATVRTAAGLFDVSHMGEFEIAGPGATAFLQKMTVNDVESLAVGDAQYSLLLNEHGGIIDDIIVYCLAVDQYLLVVNAGNAETDWHWLMAHQREDAQLVNRSEEYALLALQGPKADTILQPLTTMPLGTIRRFGIAPTHLHGIPMLLARTGYTGEPGYEMFIPAKDAALIWRTLLAAGKPHGLIPCGLGARDTLRLEMGYPLHGHEITIKTTPWETRLSWVVKLDKGDFIGRDALSAQKAAGWERQLVGFTMVDPGIPRAGYPLITHHKPVGYVTSGTMSPSLRVGIGLGFLPKNIAQPHTKFSVDIRGTERLAEVVQLPFYHTQ